MTKTLHQATRRSIASRSFRRLGLLAAAAWVLGLAGCAVEFQNPKPAQEFAERSKPPGSVYLGWRVFQDRCARCHGPFATGTSVAPDLLPRVRLMGQRQFVGLVLTRYDWMRPAVVAGEPPPTREALIDDVTQRKAGPISMPEWQGEPRVTAHVVDLYAYLSARAAGAQGPERPAP